MPNPLLQTEGSADGRDEVLYSGTIIDAYFAPPSFDPSKLQLAIRSRLDDADLIVYPWIESGEHTRWFGIGNGWTLVRDGEAVESPEKAGKLFHAKTAMGYLINQLAMLPNAEAVLGDDFDPRNGKCWKGLHVTWGEVVVTRSRPRPATDDAGQPMLDGQGKVIAEVDAKGKTKFENYQGTMVLPTAIGTTETPVAIESVDLDAYGLTEIQKDALATLNASAPNDAAFQAGAFAIDGIMGNAEFVKVLNGNVAGVRAALPF